MQKNKAGKLVPDLFNQDLYNQVLSNLVVTYFDRPQRRHTVKTKFITFQTVDPEICSILIFY